MKLLTKALQKKLPALYSQEKLGEQAIVHVHYFHPLSNWDWFGTEFSNGTFFGLVHGFEEELGYFSLAELESVNIKGMRIERDLYWKPKTIAECRRKNV